MMFAIDFQFQLSHLIAHEVALPSHAFHKGEKYEGSHLPQFNHFLLLFYYKQITDWSPIQKLEKIRTGNSVITY